MSTEDDAGIEPELEAWLKRNWDPDLLVTEWWERVGDAGWTAPSGAVAGTPAGRRSPCTVRSGRTGRCRHRAGSA